jgi:hypothetical protein
MLKKEFNQKAYPTMQSNIINLNLELEAREDSRALTPKQEMTIELRNDYNKKAGLRRAIEFHKIAYKHRVKEYKDIAERIELQEEKLLRV